MPGTIKVSAMPNDTGPTLDDLVMTVDGSTSKRSALQKVLDLFSDNPNVSDEWQRNQLPAVSTIVYKGNRSYEVTYASDVSTILSPTMRCLFDRTTASPTQCTSLNGSTQYWSKASPTGTLISTTAYSIVGKFKISSYANNHTLFNLGDSVNNGMYFYINTAGLLTSISLNTSAIFRTVQSVQAVPINKWVEYALLWSATGTCYILINGKSIPITTSNTGAFTALTAPTTNLRIGANSGGSFLLGKTQTVGLFNAQITETTARSYMGRAFLGTETSLTFAVNFDGSATDMVSGTNTLSAVASAVATNTDSAYSNLNGTPNGQYDMALVMSVATNVVMYQVPEGCTLPTSGGVDTVSFSGSYAPHGWSNDTSRWVIGAYYRTQVTSTPTINQFTQHGSMQLTEAPVGPGKISYQMAVYASDSAAANNSVYYTLSTSSAAVAIGAEEDITMSGRMNTFVVALLNLQQASFSKPIDLAAAATYYFMVDRVSTNTTIGVDADNGPAKIEWLPAGI